MAESPIIQHDIGGDDKGAQDHHTNGSPRYETSDVNARLLGIGSIGFISFTFGSLILAVLIYLVFTNNTWNIFGFYIQSPDTVRVGPGSQAPDVARIAIPPPPNPILQSNLTAWADMQVMRQDAGFVLDTAAWIDRDRGVIRIPLERAIEISVEAGLPFTSKAPAPPEAPLAQPSPMSAPPIDEGQRIERTP